MGKKEQIQQYLTSLEATLNEMSLTNEGQNFYKNVNEFLKNPNKYLINSQNSNNDNVDFHEKNQLEKITLEESEQKVEQFIKNAKSQGKEIWYSSFPDPEGFFWDDKKQKSIEYNSFYVITKLPSSDDAEFMILPEDETKMKINAISSWKQYIRPVCNIILKQNVNSYEESKIIQHKQGKLYHEGMKWKIRDKEKDGILIDLYAPGIIE
ncbi:MAG: hypothetical protein WC812_03480 [Candidatus Pacearchaeota archaeon]|jgi:hypothetical protein